MAFVFLAFFMTVLWHLRLRKAVRPNESHCVGKNIMLFLLLIPMYETGTERKQTNNNDKALTYASHLYTP